MKRLSREFILINSRPHTPTSMESLTVMISPRTKMHFLHLLAQSYGVLRDPLRHVVCRGLVTIKSFVN
jgi:hypothetical protein